MPLYLSLTDELKSLMDAPEASVTDWRIVYGSSAENNKVSVVVPSPNSLNETGKTNSQWWEWVSTRGVEVPPGVPFVFMSTTNIPSDRTFRDAWRFSATQGIQLTLPS